MHKSDEFGRLATELLSDQQHGNLFCGRESASPSHCRSRGNACVCCARFSKVDSGVNFQLLAWTANPQQKIAVQTHLNLAIHRGLPKTASQPPLPQRNIRIRGDPRISTLGLNRR
jgi:hypothetical protein